MSKREIIELRLGRKGDGSIARHAPFAVFAENPDGCGLYEKEPEVIAQMAPDEDIARFEANWDGKEWKFGRRVQDA